MCCAANVSPVNGTLAYAIPVPLHEVGRDVSRLVVGPAIHDRVEPPRRDVRRVRLAADDDAADRCFIFHTPSDAASERWGCGWERPLA
jgi:hypothetical protein